MGSNSEAQQGNPISDLVHPKAYWVTNAADAKVSMGWTNSEEDELMDGIKFMQNHVCVNNVSDFAKLINEVSFYLRFILKKKADVNVIRRKLRHLTDMYRHFKMFIYMKDGVRYNGTTNSIRVGPKYWKSIDQENELDAYFRVHGFRLYEACCQFLDYDKMDQFSSYIDEAVHVNIPVGIKLPGSNHYHYLKHRAGFPHVYKSESNMRYKNSKWKKENLDRYFYTNGWSADALGDFMHKLVETVNERMVEDEDSYKKLVYSLARVYDEPEDPLLSMDGIREKIRSIAYVYQLFKRFVFKTIGVEYNFYQYTARVNNNYWETPGKEPLYMWFFRRTGFTVYQQCYHVFDVMELDRFAYGNIDGAERIDPAIPKGVEVSDEEDVFKSYYQAD